MGSVVGVGGFGVEVFSVGDEAVVAPVGPQLALGAEQAGAAHDESQLGPVARRRRRRRRPASMVVSATWASPPRVYSMLAQASSSMGAMTALTLAFCGIVIE